MQVHTLKKSAKRMDMNGEFITKPPKKKNPI